MLFTIKEKKENTWKSAKQFIYKGKIKQSDSHMHYVTDISGIVLKYCTGGLGGMINVRWWGKGLVWKMFVHNIFAWIIVSWTKKPKQQMFHSRDEKPRGDDNEGKPREKKKKQSTQKSILKVVSFLLLFPRRGYRCRLLALLNYKKRAAHQETGVCKLSSRRVITALRCILEAFVES